MSVFKPDSDKTLLLKTNVQYLKLKKQIQEKNKINLFNFAVNKTPVKLYTFDQNGCTLSNVLPAVFQNHYFFKKKYPDQLLNSFQTFQSASCDTPITFHIYHSDITVMSQ